MLASHKIAYQFLLPCNPSTILFVSLGKNKENEHFYILRSKMIIEKSTEFHKTFLSCMKISYLFKNSYIDELKNQKGIILRKIILKYFN